MSKDNVSIIREPGPNEMRDPVMRADHDSAGITLAEHLYFSREAATGGRGVGGGGCGCN